MQCNHKGHLKCNCGIRIREKFEDPTVLAFQMERRTTSQGCRQSPGAGKADGEDPPEGTQPWGHIFLGH